MHNRWATWAYEPINEAAVHAKTEEGSQKRYSNDFLFASGAKTVNSGAPLVTLQCSSARAESRTHLARFGTSSGGEMVSLNTMNSLTSVFERIRQFDNPFAHICMNNKVDEFCSNCLRIPKTKKLLKCASCEFARYCDKVVFHFSFAYLQFYFPFPKIFHFNRFVPMDRGKAFSTTPLNQLMNNNLIWG